MKYTSVPNICVGGNRRHLHVTSHNVKCKQSESLHFWTRVFMSLVKMRDFWLFARLCLQNDMEYEYNFFYSTYTHFLCTTHSLKTNHVIVMIASLLPQLNMRWEKYFGNNKYVHHTSFSKCLEINDLLYQAWFFSAVSLFAALNFPSINPILLETLSCSTFLSKVWLILNFVNFFFNVIAN